MGRRRKEKNMEEGYYHLYLEELKKVPPCTDDERQSLLDRLLSKDLSVRDRLIEGHLILALAVAKDYRDKGLPMSDLVQEANLALTMAVSAYQGGDLLAQAKEQIVSRLDAALKEQKAEKALGEEMAARVNVLQEVSRVLAEELGREATVEELAAKMQMPPGDIKEIMKLAVDALSVDDGYGQAVDEQTKTMDGQSMGGQAAKDGLDLPDGEEYR